MILNWWETKDGFLFLYINRDCAVRCKKHNTTDASEMDQEAAKN